MPCKDKSKEQKQVIAKKCFKTPGYVYYPNTCECKKEDDKDAKERNRLLSKGKGSTTYEEEKAKWKETYGDVGFPRKENWTGGN